MLNMAAELAQARGREKRAEELSQQAKALAPAQNPGQVLAAELREAPAGSGWAGRQRTVCFSRWGIPQRGLHKIHTYLY